MKGGILSMERGENEGRGNRILEWAWVKTKREGRGKEGNLRVQLGRKEGEKGGGGKTS